MKDEKGYDHRDSFLEPLLIPSRTTHRRLFPAKHSFSYPYFFIGVPIGWSGPAGTILATDQDGRISKRQQTWFTVDAEDYLGRGSHPDGLQGKLNEYLQSQEVDSQKFKYAYLVTAPRSLGYSFNPISFWYLYDGRKALKAMILEVNNTFDERRMYYLEPDQAGSNTECGTDINKPPSSHGEPKANRFKQTWRKDFHVSPFNDRPGTYSVSAVDPFSPANSSKPSIDNTIVLSSPEGQPKLIARVFSTCPPTAPYSLSRLETISFLLRWSWVGLLTDLRILKEARVLWMVKKLQIFGRPEVYRTSVGRKETKEERAIEIVFISILQILASEQSLQIQYTAAAGSDRGKTRHLQREENVHPDRIQREGQTASFDIRVLTPEFYSQVARSPDISSVIDRYCLNAAEREATLSTSNPDALQATFRNMEVRACRRAGCSELSWRWYFLALLRTEASLPQILAQLVRRRLLRSSIEADSLPQLSEFDHIALLASNRKAEIASAYQQAAITILLADRLAWGSVTVLRFLTVTVQVSVLVLLACVAAVWLLHR